MKITPEAVKERIAALESAGELSLKEQFYLEALRQLVASVGSYPVALQPELANYPPAPVVSADLLHTAASAIEDLLTTKDRTGAGVWFDLPFRLRSAANAQPAPVSPVCTCPSGDGSLRWPCPVHPGNSPVIPDGYVMVPMRLTAENGAKGALAGEFSETKFVNCSECFGDDECETCDGSGRIEITVPVSWTNIKEIWAKGVEHFAAAPQPQNAPQNIPEIIPDSCTWTFSNYDDHWTGTCGAEWVFNDGGPEENGVKFCPKCGKSVAVAATEGTEE